ncbi:DUF6153 family protein [Streptomyces nanhaiensis]|uniref:DUF6153 family protein n=1 Tax=Streptomyces nanhaiensis TaxID=679319 RepID=UPI00399C7104
MTSSTRASSRPAGRGLVLLVMAVLAGVLGMHALAPGGTLSTLPDARHALVAAQPADAHQASGDCSPTDGGSGHLEHADETCAAAGIGTAYAPPSLSAAVVDAPAAAAPSGSAVRSAVSDRAPPDLAELQLLRI